MEEMPENKNRWLASFEIFSRNGLKDFDVSAEHDVVYVHAAQITYDSEDGKALQALGWNKDEEHDPEDGTPPNEEASWYHYV